MSFSTLTRARFIIWGNLYDKKKRKELDEAVKAGNVFMLFTAGLACENTPALLRNGTVM